MSELVYENNYLNDGLEFPGQTGDSATRYETGLEAFNAGDELAFGRIYAELFPPVFFFARRFVDLEDAQDLTADVFYALWKMPRNFTSLKQVKIYLQVAVRNRCLDLLRKQNAFAQAAEISSLPAVETSADEVRQQLIEKVFRRIDTLPAGQRTILRLAYLDGLKNPEIAQKLQLSINTVRAQKGKALKTLRGLLGKDFETLLFLSCFFLPVK